MGGTVLLDRLRLGLTRVRPRRLSVRPGERRAAVLVPVLEGDGEPRLLLERRSARLTHHAGQYSFPGGVVEPGDGRVERTALREAREETGIDPEDVEILGTLPDLRTPTGFVITPVVGLVRGRQHLRPESGEVEELVTVPLAFLTRPGAFRRVIRRSRGVLIHGDALVYEGRVIWGATARILLALRRVLRQEPG